MCSISGPDKTVNGSLVACGLHRKYFRPARLQFVCCIEVRKAGSQVVCAFVWFNLFPHDTSSCYQAMVAVSERSVFFVAPLAKSCIKVQTFSFRQYKDLSTLQWFSFTHNEVSPRFLLSKDDL